MYFRFMESLHGIYAIKEEPEIINEIRVRKGQFLTNDQLSRLKSEMLVFKLKSGCNEENPPQHYEGITVPVFSNKLIGELKKCGVDNLQTVPAVLRNETTGESWNEYSLVNIVGLLSCADMEMSEYTIIGTRPNSDIPLAHFQKLIIDEARANGQYLFRLAEEPSTILIHESIKNHLMSNPPETGRWGISFRTLD